MLFLKHSKSSEDFLGARVLCSNILRSLFVCPSFSYQMLRQVVLYPEGSTARPIVEEPLEFHGLPRHLVSMMIALETLTDRTRARALSSTTDPSQWRMFDIVVLLYNAECLWHEWADFASESIVHAEMDEWLACYRRKRQFFFSRIQQRSHQQGRK